MTISKNTDIIIYKNRILLFLESQECQFFGSLGMSVFGSLGMSVFGSLGDDTKCWHFCGISGRWYFFWSFDFPEKNNRQYALKSLENFHFSQNFFSADQQYIQKKSSMFDNRKFRCSTTESSDVRQCNPMFDNRKFRCSTM